MGRNRKARPYRNKVQKLRINKGLGLEDFASAVGLSLVTVVAIERGYYSPAYETADRIAAFLGMPVETVFPEKSRLSPSGK